MFCRATSAFGVFLSDPDAADMCALHAMTLYQLNIFVSVGGGVFWFGVLVAFIFLHMLRG